MAKINTGTITADGSGNWSSNAIAFTAGAKRVYMRVNGTEVLYRDFTATTAASVSYLGAWGSANSGTANTATVTSVTATGNGLLVIVPMHVTPNVSPTSVVFGTGSGTVGTITKQTTTVSGASAGSADIYTATFSGTLTNKQVISTYAASTAFPHKVIALDNVNASNPIGVIIQPAYHSNTVLRDIAFTGLTAGSMVLAFAYSDNSSAAGTVSAGTTSIDRQNDTGFFRRSTDAVSGTTFTIAGTGYSACNHVDCGIEIKG